MITGTQISESIESSEVIDPIILPMLSLHARAIVLLSMTYGLGFEEFRQLIGLHTVSSFRRWVIAPLSVAGLIVGERRSYGYVYRVTGKGRRYVVSELSRIQAEGASLVQCALSCSNVRKDALSVLAGYFPGADQK